uniref:O-fucosyltransferase family protein n=1 Tax=Setaria digitata TaxID=48799 RepID=A0A915PR51_9BILA
MSIYERITLVLHISYDYLTDNILEQILQLKSWDGPITLVIAIPSADVYNKIRGIKEMLLRFPPYVLHKLSAHVLFQSNMGCNNDIIDKLSGANIEWRYPVNVARNVARMFVRSKYVLIGDSEFVFPKGFESRMRALAQNQLTRDPKTVLVVRIFEVNETIKEMPRNKKELRELFFKGLAVEFHARYNVVAHAIPHLDQWFNKQENEEINVNSIIKFSERGWEPQFVSLNTIPFHDENFPFSLRDNTVLTSQLRSQSVDRFMS